MILSFYAALALSSIFEYSTFDEKSELKLAGATSKLGENAPPKIAPVKYETRSFQKILFSKSILSFLAENVDKGSHASRIVINCSTYSKATSLNIGLDIVRSDNVRLLSTPPSTGLQDVTSSISILGKDTRLTIKEGVHGVTALASSEPENRELYGRVHFMLPAREKKLIVFSASLLSATTPFSTYDSEEDKAVGAGIAGQQNISTGATSNSNRISGIIRTTDAFNGVVHVYNMRLDSNDCKNKDDLDVIDGNGMTGKFLAPSSIDINSFIVFEK